LHVVDISHPNALNQFQAVQETLDEIDAGHIPIVTALNKVDRLHDPARAQEILRQFPKAVATSSLNGTGVPELLNLVQAELYESYTPLDVRLPYQQGALISLFHEAGQVDLVEHERGGVVMHGRIPGRLVAQFRRWMSTEMEQVGVLEDEEEV
jgi:GTPase